MTKTASSTLRVIYILLTLVVCSPQAQAETLPGPFRARVVRVIDGDTLIAEVGLWFGQSVIEHIRIAGIDAPEMKGRCPSEIEAARSARQYLSGLVGTGQIELIDVRREKYGRALARVMAGGFDISTQMIEAGYARPYLGGKRLSWC